MTDASTPKMLTAADLAAVLSAARPKTEPVEVPEWGGTVHLRELPGDIALELYDRGEALPHGQRGRFLFMLLSEVLVDGEGRKLFTVEQLAGMRSETLPVLRRLQDRAHKLLGWGDEAAAKNDSGEAAPVASPTA